MSQATTSPNITATNQTVSNVNSTMATTRTTTTLAGAAYQLQSSVVFVLISGTISTMLIRHRCWATSVAGHHSPSSTWVLLINEHRCPCDIPVISQKPHWEQTHSLHLLCLHRPLKSSRKLFVLEEWKWSSFSFTEIIDVCSSVLYTAYKILPKFGYILREKPVFILFS